MDIKMEFLLRSSLNCKDTFVQKLSTKFVLYFLMNSPAVSEGLHFL